MEVLDILLLCWELNTQLFPITEHGKSEKTIVYKEYET